MNMVERVARAIWTERVQDATKNGIDLGPFEAWAEANNIYGETRAAIAAMREPTTKMLIAATGESDGVVNLGRADDPSYSAKDDWQAMIDSALTSSPIPVYGERK